MPRRGLVLLPLVLCCPPALGEGGPALEELMARLAAVPERRAVFREHRRFAALDGVLESSGRLFYRRGTVEKQTDWPVPERLEMDGDRLVITAGTDAPRVVDVGMAPELRVLMDAVRGPLVGDGAALRRGFEVVTGGTMDAWTLVLVPREGAGRRVLRRVMLAGRGDWVDRLTVVQANGDEQVMDISAR